MAMHRRSQLSARAYSPQRRASHPTLYARPRKGGGLGECNCGMRVELIFGPIGNFAAGKSEFRRVRNPVCKEEVTNNQKVRANALAQLRPKQDLPLPDRSLRGEELFPAALGRARPERHVPENLPENHPHLAGVVHEQVESLERLPR